MDGFAVDDDKETSSSHAAESFVRLTTRTRRPNVAVTSVAKQRIAITRSLPIEDEVLEEGRAMANGADWKSRGALFIIFSAGMTAHAAEQGNTTGVASFQAKGDSKQHKPAVTVWNGTFVGVSIAETGKGPLHNSGWDCTGEAVVQDGNVYRAGGFCLVTDPDGDTVNLLWERTNVPGSFLEPKTKGTYLSGTGKYSGIQGNYTLACRQGGATCAITTGSYKIP